MVRVRVFTKRSAGIGVGTGALVAAAFGQLAGASWGLAVMNGLAAGALALAVSIVLRDGRFDFMNTRRRVGVWLLSWIVIATPWFFVDDIVELQLSRADEAALTLLFGLTGFAAYTLGAITATLDHLDGDDAADPRLHQVTPRPGERRAS